MGKSQTKSIRVALAVGIVTAALTPAAGQAACCTVASVNAASGTITYRVDASGETCSMAVPDRAALATFRVGDRIGVAGAGGSTGVSGNAATGTTGGNCGSNVSRGADTRPKECIATNSAGQQYKVACPDNVVIRATR